MDGVQAELERIERAALAAPFPEPRRLSGVQGSRVGLMAAENLLKDPKGRAETGKRQGPNGRYALVSPLGERLRAGTRSSRTEPARARTPARGIAEPRFADRDGQDPAVGADALRDGQRARRVAGRRCSPPTSLRPRQRRLGPSRQHDPQSSAEPLLPEQGRVQRAAGRRVIELESGVHWERLTTWNDRGRRVPLRGLRGRRRLQP